MDKKKKEKLYDLEGNVINLYNVVELKKEYTEEAFPAYGYYGILVVTLDDGDCAHNAVEIANKYKVYVTYFMITAWFKIPEIETQYVDYQSHTHNMHNNWKCPGGNQGGQILCEDKNKILEDLKKNTQINLFWLLLWDKTMKNGNRWIKDRNIFSHSYHIDRDEC